MKTKIDVVSGFLGAGKTTLIKKILEDIPQGTKVAVIENEFGDIGIDGDILKRYDINIREITGGCICCSLHGDFLTAITDLVNEYEPNHIIIEPTGIGKLSDVMSAIESAKKTVELELNFIAAVVDPLKYHIFIKMFGEFFNNQISTAKTIFLSRIQMAEQQNIADTINSLQKINNQCSIVAVPWNDLTGTDIMKIGEEDCHITPYITDSKLCHSNNNNGDNSIAQITSISMCLSKTFSKIEFKTLLEKMTVNKNLGFILRSKGFFKTLDNTMIQYDYTPGEIHFRKAEQRDRSSIIIIGKNVNKIGLTKYFN